MSWVEGMSVIQVEAEWQGLNDLCCVLVCATNTKLPPKPNPLNNYYLSMVHCTIILYSTRPLPVWPLPALKPDARDERYTQSPRLFPEAILWRRRMFVPASINYCFNRYFRNFCYWKRRLTGSGCLKNCRYPSFIAAKSFIVVMKTLTLTTFSIFEPPASRIAVRFLRAWIWDWC